MDCRQALSELIFKIEKSALWEAAIGAGVYQGSALDKQDGFIHFSSANQVRETFGKHFDGQSDLVLIAVQAADLGDALKWEPSRGGALFPHLYGSLSMAAVAGFRPISSEVGLVAIPAWGIA